MRFAGHRNSSIDLTGTARKDGKLVGSGSSQGFEPALVAPGEIAYGYVYFDTDLAETTGYEFDFTVEAEPAEGSYSSKLPVTITEVNNTGGQLVGSGTNEADKTMSGPIGTAVLCFDAVGAVTDDISGFLEQDELAAGASGSFSIDLYDEACANGIVAASGFDF